jgi:hypothetical protein
MKTFRILCILILFSCQTSPLIHKKTPSLPPVSDVHKRVLLLIESQKNDQNSKLFSLFTRTSLENLLSSEFFEIIPQEDYLLNQSVLEERHKNYTLQEIESDIFKTLQPDLVLSLKFKIDEDFYQLQYLVTSLVDSESISKREIKIKKKDYLTIPEFIARDLNYKINPAIHLRELDTSFYELLLKSNLYFTNKDYQNSEIIYLQLLSLLESTDHKNLSIYNQIIYKLGICYFEMKNLEMAKKIFNKSVQFLNSNNLKNYDLYSNILFYLASIHNLESNLDTALDFLLESKKRKMDVNLHYSYHYIFILDKLAEIYKIKKSKENIQELHLKILDSLYEMDTREAFSYSGILYSIVLYELDQANFKNALGLLESIIKSNEHVNETKTENYIEVLSQLGFVQMNLDLFSSASQTFLKAKAIRESLNSTNTEGYSFITMNLGLIRMQEEKFIEAYRFFKIAEKTYKSIGKENDLEFSIVLSQLGILEERNNQFESALKYYKAAQSIRTDLQLEVTEMFAETHMHIGNLFKDSKKNPCGSILYFEKAMEIYKKLGNKQQEALASSDFLEAKKLCK